MSDWLGPKISVTVIHKYHKRDTVTASQRFVYHFNAKNEFTTKACQFDIFYGNGKDRNIFGKFEIFFCKVSIRIDFKRKF